MARKVLRYKFQSGQALLELAIFGSLLIMLLGVLVNYGLHYNFQQKAIQDSFRKALWYAGRSIWSFWDQSVGVFPVQTDYSQINDKHIPDPRNPFGIGQIIPVTHTSTVTRDFQLQATPDREKGDKELPTKIYNINGKEILLTTAGFLGNHGIVKDIPKSRILKYELIFGKGNVQETADSWKPPKKWPKAALSEGNPVVIRLAELIETTPARVSADSYKGFLRIAKSDINVIDDCDGQIMNYHTALRRCRMLVDKDICISECNRASSSEIREHTETIQVVYNYLGTNGAEIYDVKLKCSDICSMPPVGLNQSPLPWYCEGGHLDASSPTTPCYAKKYVFPKLVKIFGKDGKKIEALGLQPFYTKTMTIENAQLYKKEENPKITTTDNVHWQEEIYREIYRVDKTIPDVRRIPNTSTIRQDKDVKWETPK